MQYIMKIEHTYDYADGGKKSLFEARMPEDLTEIDRRLVTESVRSLDLHPWSIIMRCSNPCNVFTKKNGIFVKIEGRQYDTTKVCGQYKKPFKIVELARDGTVTKVLVFENPAITILDTLNEREADVTYKITYTSRYIQTLNDIC